MMTIGTDVREETLADPEAKVDAATAARFHTTVLRESRRLQSLVEDLMSLSRIEAEKHDPPRETIDIGQLAATISAEVDRYIGMAGQALAYQIGYRCFRELRVQAESQLGSEFRVRDFHDALMAAGAVTLPVLREFIQDWIESRKAPLAAAA